MKTKTLEFPFRFVVILLTVASAVSVSGSLVTQDVYSVTGSATAYSMGQPGATDFSPFLYQSTQSSTQTVGSTSGSPFDVRILNGFVSINTFSGGTYPSVNTGSAIVASSQLTLSGNSTGANSASGSALYQENAAGTAWVNLTTNLANNTSVEPYWWIKFGNISWTGTGAGSNVPIILWARITNAVGVIQNFSWNGDLSPDHSAQSLTMATAANNTIYFPLQNFSNGQTNNLPSPNGRDYYLTDSNFVQNVRQLEIGIFGNGIGQQVSIEVLGMGFGVIPEPSPLGLVAGGVGLLFLSRRWIGRR